MASGGDNVGVEQPPSAVSDDWIPEHSHLIAECGIAMMEVLNCEELSEAELCEFACFAATIPLRGTTGALLRAVVFPLCSQSHSSAGQADVVGAISR